jgi:hypothetical protein
VVLDKYSYVPILRRRPAELAALTNLLNEDFSSVVPFFEMCEHILPIARRNRFVDTDNNAYFWEVIKSIAAACGRKPYFIDFGNVEDVFSIQNGYHPLETYFRMIEFHSLKAIPVTSLRRSVPYQNAIQKIAKWNKPGVCLRLGLSDIQNPSLILLVQLFLRSNSIDPNKVHIVVDLKSYTESTPTVEEICRRIPMIEQWASFTVLWSVSRIPFPSEEE